MGLNVTVQLNLNQVGEVWFRILSQKEDRHKPREETNTLFIHDVHTIRMAYFPELRNKGKDGLIFYLQGRDDQEKQAAWYAATSLSSTQSFNGRTLKDFMHLINLYNQLPAETAWIRIEDETTGFVWESP